MIFSVYCAILKLYHPSLSFYYLLLSFSPVSLNPFLSFPFFSLCIYTYPISVYLSIKLFIHLSLSLQSTLTALPPFLLSYSVVPTSTLPHDCLYSSLAGHYHWSVSSSLCHFPPPPCQAPPPSLLLSWSLSTYDCVGLPQCLPCPQGSNCCASFSLIRAFLLTFPTHHEHECVLFLLFSPCRLYHVNYVWSTLCAMCSCRRVSRERLNFDKCVTDY